MSWVQQQMVKGVNPRSVLTQILGGSWPIPQGFSDLMLWHLIVNMLSEPPKRERLRHINTLEDVIRLIKVCKKIIVLTGAGVSVSCGIPDFRSKDGIYARLSVDFPDLPDPQAMFDIHYFRRDPRPFFKFAREIYPGQFTPSLCHRFIRLIEQNNKLLRNYTQNIDTLEQVANINRVIQCHGSFAHATCQRCSHRVDAEAIKEEIFSQRIPKCSLCSQNSPPVTMAETPHSLTQNNSQNAESEDGTTNLSPTNSSKGNPQQSTPTNSKENPSTTGNHVTQSSAPPPPPRPPSSSSSAMEPVMKPDIVFFGEGLPDEFHDRMAEDKDECDLLIVIGSSLKVRPVALIPSSIPPNVPQILINREPLGHLTFDVELLGDCDVIVSELCRRLGDNWKDLNSREPLSEIQELPPRSCVEGGSSSSRGSPSHATHENAPHPKDESDIEALRACWAPKVKESMAARLPEGKYLFCGGHRYVFPGAEVFYDPDDERDTDSRSSDLDEIEGDDSLQNGSSGEDARLLDANSAAAPSLFHASSSSSSSSSSSQSVTTTTTTTTMTTGELEGDASGALVGRTRRRSSSQEALSEDVDSLLSTASDTANNNILSDEVPWGPTEPLKNVSRASATMEEEDWTTLSASLDATSAGEARLDEHVAHFEISETNGNVEQRSQPTECSV